MNSKYSKILNTTIKLFINNGIKKTTMDEIAESANVSKVTIYKYFGDKDSLYHIVGKSILDEYSDRMKEQLNQDNDISIKLANIMDSLSELIITNKLTLCKELSKLNNKLDINYTKFNTSYKDVVMQLISDGKNQGIIKQNIADEYIFHYIDMGLTYFETNTKYRDKITNDENFKSEFMEFLLSNIFRK